MSVVVEPQLDEPAAPSMVVRPGVGRELGRVGRTRLSRSGWFLVCLALLTAVSLASLMIGALPIRPLDALRLLVSPDGSVTAQIMIELRVPRTLLGLGAGAALGVAGALIQALTRNPLADPGILGVNAGASFSVVVAVTWFGVSGVSGMIIPALIGAVITTVAVYLIGSADRRRSASPATLVLAGVALGAVLQGAAGAISLLTPSSLDRMRFWQVGQLTGVDLPSVVWGLPLFVVGLTLAVLVARPLNAVALGDERATALGVRLLPTRTVVVVAVTLLCGGATALCGPIGFVGLMVPHVVRWLFGVDQRWIVAFTAVLAPALLLISDIAGRLVLWPAEAPVGLVTALVGAPVLIMLARRQQAVGL